MTTLVLTIVTMVCGECGVSYGLEEGYRNTRMRDHSLNWVCPNGHGRVFVGQTEAEIQRERAGRAERELSYQRDRADDNLRSANAFKGHLTRAKKRQAAGVCGFCQRSFKNVRDHVENKHPDEIDSV